MSSLKEIFTLHLLPVWRPVVFMIAVISLSNYAVQFPINDWLTYGAFTYPFVFLVCDLTNRAIGVSGARKVAWIGFFIAFVLSIYLADLRIASASACAFLSSQLLDIFVFNRLRQRSWWIAPLIGSALASVLDTFVFFGIAFGLESGMWLALGDLIIKFLMAVVLLAPYRLMLPRLNWWGNLT